MPRIEDYALLGKAALNERFVDRRQRGNWFRATPAEVRPDTLARRGFFALVEFIECASVGPGHWPAPANT